MLNTSQLHSLLATLYRSLAVGREEQQQRGTVTPDGDSFFQEQELVPEFAWEGPHARANWISAGKCCNEFSTGNDDSFGCLNLEREWIARCPRLWCRRQPTETCPVTKGGDYSLEEDVMAPEPVVARAPEDVSEGLDADLCVSTGRAVQVPGSC